MLEEPVDGEPAPDLRANGDHDITVQQADAADGGALVEAPYFVSISRRTGFRRLHKTNCCGVMPWQCHLIEWVKNVSDSTADAYCKVCLKKCSPETREDSSRTSGSSSSTENEEDEWERIPEASDLSDVPIV